METAHEPASPAQKTRSMEDLILGEHLLILAFLAFCILGTFVAYLYFGRTLITTNPTPVEPNRAFVAESDDGEPLAQTVEQRFANSRGPLRLGLIPGHLNFDSGAVCDDGLQEVMINYTVATQTADILRQYGIVVDLLDEMDDRLTFNYSADAVVSLHADSCTGAATTMSGYKTAASQGANATLLKSCIDSSYATATGLAFNENTVTNHMTEYHVFGRLNNRVPALILEMGFMGGDRNLLVNESPRVAQAVADGVICFVEKVQ